MRWVWVGLFVLLAAASGAWAQVTGSVTSIGYAGYYRPDGWVPLRLSLGNLSDKPLEVQIRVQLQDLDKDQAIYARTLTIGPRQNNQTAWAYFLPQPTDGGIPEAGNANGPRLGDVLRVNVYDKSGALLTTLPIPPNVEARDVEPRDQQRGARLVLVVRRNAAIPRDEYNNAAGLTEDVRFVDVSVDELPDHLLGYSPVDDIIWLDASLPDFAGTGSFSALQDWVRRGGNLAVIHSGAPGQLAPLANANMLPVAGWNPATPGVLPERQAESLGHLIAIVADTAGRFDRRIWDNLAAERRKFLIAQATPRDDAMVDAWVTVAADGDRPAQRVPLIARRAYGMGSVVFVSQNLSDINLANGPVVAPVAGQTRPTSGPAAARAPTNGWPRIWDRVMGWRNQTQTDAEHRSLADRNRGEYARENGQPVDIGAAVAAGVEHSGRSTAYVFLAVLFFIAYWIVAGPGAYFYLSRKKRKALSWIVFGGSAVAATLVTILVVKLLLSGGTAVRHVSVVRLVPGESAADGSPRFNATISSRLGLYIPSDGPQRVQVAAPAEGRSAALAPFVSHPRWVRDDAGFTDTASYLVDLDPMLTGRAPVVDFFLRSTLKKVQADWTGVVAEGITGSAEVLPEPPKTVGPRGIAQDPLIAGILTNRTGRRLSNVYFVFSHGPQDANAAGRVSNDRMLYLPAWPDGAAIDLAQLYKTASAVGDDSTPGNGNNLYGQLDPTNTTSWSAYLYRGLEMSRTGQPFDDRSRGYLQSFPLASLIDRVGPFRNQVGTARSEDRRPEAVRRGFRDLNVSSQVAAGRLVILANAEGVPAPIPLDVNGERVAGEGVTFYQIALPLSRERFKPKPATQPATQPLTQPATAPATRPADR